MRVFCGLFLYRIFSRDFEKILRKYTESKRIFARGSFCRSSCRLVLSVPNACRSFFLVAIFCNRSAVLRPSFLAELPSANACRSSVSFERTVRSCNALCVLSVPQKACPSSELSSERLPFVHSFKVAELPSAFLELPKRRLDLRSSRRSAVSVPLFLAELSSANACRSFFSWPSFFSCFLSLFFAYSLSYFFVCSFGFRFLQKSVRRVLVLIQVASLRSATTSPRQNAKRENEKTNNRKRRLVADPLAKAVAFSSIIFLFFDFLAVFFRVRVVGVRARARAPFACARACSPSAWTRIPSAFPLVGGKRGEHFGKCSPLSPPFNFFCLSLRKAVAFLVRSFAFSLSCRTSFGSFFPKAWPSFFSCRSSALFPSLFRLLFRTIFVRKWLLSRFSSWKTRARVSSIYDRWHKKKS